MADQGYEYDQYAPQSSERLFSSSMFGFNKEEVLEYLDELADENYQRQESADHQIRELTQRIQSLESASYQQAEDTFGMVPEDLLAESTRQAGQLADELDIAKAATQQAEEELAEIREQLFNAQQETGWLRDESKKSDAQIADLHRQLDEASAGQWVDSATVERQISELSARLNEAVAAAEKAREEKEAAQLAARNARAAAPSVSAAAAIIADANVEADRIRALANDEKDRVRRQIRSSAGGLAESITNLRGELSGVENDVSHVLEAVQDALADIVSALGRTEQSLNTLGVQVDRFPSAAAPVPKPAPQQVVYFQPGTQPLAGKAPSRASLRASTPESYGQGGFRRIAPATADSGVRPFRPAYTTGPAVAPRWPAEEAYPEEVGEERIRALAENLVDTLVQMLT